MLVLILIRSFLIPYNVVVGGRVDESGSRHTYLFNNLPRGATWRPVATVLRQRGIVWKSKCNRKKVSYREYTYRTFRRKEIFEVIFQSVGVPTLCTYVSSEREKGGLGMDNRWGGGSAVVRSRTGREGWGEWWRRYFMGTGFYCAKLLGHLLREVCL